jgi:NitT/TauT family transport system permease protein
MTDKAKPAGMSDVVTNRILGALGIVLMFGIWEVIGQTEVLGSSWPAFSEVMTSFADNRAVFQRAFNNTILDAVIGFAIGMTLGFTIALIGLMIPALRGAMGRLATTANAIPWIALGPLVVMVLSPQRAPVIFAAMGVFFASFVAISSGFRLAGQAHQDMLSVFGSDRRTRLRRLELPVAVPSIIYAAKLGAPASVFGVIFGEWFGTTEPSIGLLIVTSLQQFLTVRLWAAAFLASSIAILAFGAFAYLEGRALRRFR